MKKRVVAALLAGVMVFGMLTGCGKKEEAAVDTTTETKEADVVEESADSEKKEEVEKADVPDGETVTVKWCMFGDKAPDHDVVLEDVNKKLKEKINVQLDLTMISQGEFNDKMKLMSTAGEDYDLTFTANWLNSFDENMSRDAFLPITGLVDEYGQDIKKSMPEWLIDVARVDGELYAVPNQQIIARQLGVAIQKEYAEKYGFDKTSLKDIRELEPFLDEIVKNEPTMFPIDKRVNAVSEKEHEGIVNMANAGGACAYIKKTDDTATLVPSMDVFADQMRLDNEWYQKGYIRKDIATVTDNTADVKANRYVCTLSSYKPGWDAEFTSRQGVEYITVPIEGTYIEATSGIETMTAINVNSKNPEAAMKLLNLVYTDKEIFNELVFGIEGTHYTKVGENGIQPIAEGTDSKYNYGGYAWRLGNQFNTYYLPGQADGLWKLTDQLNREAEVSALRGFVFNSTNVQAEIAQINAVNKEFFNSQFTTTDIEGLIKEREAKMEQAGLQKVADEIQTQIDTWKASK